MSTFKILEDAAKNEFVVFTVFVAVFGLLLVAGMCVIASFFVYGIVEEERVARLEPTEKSDFWAGFNHKSLIQFVGLLSIAAIICWLMISMVVSIENKYHSYQNEIAIWEDYGKYQDGEMSHDEWIEKYGKDPLSIGSEELSVEVTEIPAVDISTIDIETIGPLY